jgi:hypothetical protein
MPSTFFRLILITATLFLGCFSSLNAQSTQEISQSEVKNFSVPTPQNDSPFFIERQEAQAALADAGREGYGMYVPKPPHPPVQQQVKKFFKGMFASVKLLKNNDSIPMLITVEPPEFSIANHPDLAVSVKVSNARRQEIELLYPNDQRLEIVTKDSTGNVINKWSQDRTFENTEGFVAVNPSEFIVYSEKISTAAMKAGETYTIEVSLAGQKGYTTSTTVTPLP